MTNKSRNIIETKRKNSRKFSGVANYSDFTSNDIQTYAKENGFDYQKSVIVSHDESGYYMTPNVYNEKLDRISMTKDGVEYEFYTRLMNYEPLERIYDKTNDTKRSRIVLGLVFSVTLPYDLPSVLVQNVTAKTIWNIIGLNWIFVGKWVKLEGDFNKFFRVYTPAGEAPSAFVTLAPDTMVKMLSAGSGMDFEFAGRKIYFMYDVRFRARNIKNLWGLLGDASTADLDKKINIPYITKSEWGKTLARSLEYSEDIVKAFRAAKLSDEGKKLAYANLSTNRLTFIVVLQACAILLIVLLFIIYPLTLLVVIPFAILVITKWIKWNSNKRLLIKNWQDGNIRNIVR